DAMALSGGIDEQLGEEPNVAANPTPGKADNLPAILCDPKAIRVVLEGKQLKAGRAYRRHWAEAMPNGKIVDAGDHQRIGRGQVLRSSWSANKPHSATPAKISGTEREQQRQPYQLS